MLPIAPGRAAHLVARWFATPDRSAVARALDVRALPAPAANSNRVPTAEGEPLILRGDGGRLAGWSWGHGPLVLLVHGWNGRGQQLGAMARAIAARGYRAVAFDHPAHGDSSGRTVTIPDMADAIQLVSEQLGGARALVAHSLGAVASTFALSRGLRVARAVFVAPPVRPDQWLLRFGRAVGLPASADESLVAAIEQRAGVPVAALRPLDLAGRLDTALLIVHDRSDREVPYSHGESLARAWPDARLVTTEGLGHTRILSSPGIVSLVADFLGDAPAMPSVRDPHLAAIIDQLG
jgi:pimeloyl-ACP methyl ester carboxylesterase